MKYTSQQQTTIKQVKEYLKAIRTLKRERFHLLEEYKEEPAPHSPRFDETKGSSISQITKMNDYMQRRDLLLKRIQLFDRVIDQFTLVIFLLPTRQRCIIEVYMDAMSYEEMLETLNEKYFISTSTYKRELPEICLELSKYVDYQKIPSLDEINIEYLKIMKSLKESDM